MIASNFDAVQNAMAKACDRAERDVDSVDLIAVSKTFEADQIRPALELGHRAFGENRVQEAQSKWPALKDNFQGVELHLLGPLQSNKAKDAVALFDCIHSVDREKIAKAVAFEMRSQGRKLRLFIQVNTGGEDQKAGIAPQEAIAFVERCRTTHGLQPAGLMCIPPVQENPGPHFALLRKLAEEAGLAELSMGMSGDYETAIEFGATSIRVGSALFGSRG